MQLPINEKLKIALEVEEFIADIHERVAWIEDSRAKIYVRKAYRLLYPDQGKLLTTFDLAAIVVQEDCRRRGIFKNILKYLHYTHNRSATFVENVHETFLQDYLLRDGWSEAITPLCFYKLKNQNDSNAPN